MRLFKNILVVLLIFVVNISISHGQQHSTSSNDTYYTKATVDESSVEIISIGASCKTVSQEEIIFTESESGIFVAHDSVAFDESGIILTCEPSEVGAIYEFASQPNPLPGFADTVAFSVTAVDGVTTKEYKAVVARSEHLCKTGFLEAGADKKPDGWNVGGGNYSSASKGNGGAFPGDAAIRIYNSESKGLGVLTTPEYSSISTVSFAAKFSKTDDESLTIKKSIDGGSTWVDVKTFTPAEAEIPSFSGEESTDTLAVQWVEINEENVMLAFCFTGTSTTPRLMIDDIAIQSNYDPTATYQVSVTVFDIDNSPIEGAKVTLGGVGILTDSHGLAIHDNIYAGSNHAYSVSKENDTIDGIVSVASSTDFSVTLLSEDIDLFLALGQSNMAGRAEINSYVNEDFVNVSLLNNDDVWVQAINPMNLYSNIRKDEDLQKVGPSYAFAKTLSKYVDNRIGMVVNARGGTKVSEFNTTYNTSIMDKINATKLYGQFKAVLWHQGEGDRSKADQYMGTLGSFVQDIRDKIGDELYFVAGQLGPWDETGTTMPKYGEINDTIAKIASYIPNSDYVVNHNLSDLGDNTHLNLESQILLGQRYAKKILHQIYGISISIIDPIIEGDGYLVFENDTITNLNDYSVTSITGTDAIFTLHAGAGKEFTQLIINGEAINEANGTTSFSYQITPTIDTNLTVQMETIDFEETTVEGTSFQKLSFYPNPAKNILIVMGATSVFSASIFDLQGQLLISHENENTINIESLEPGTYLLLMNTNYERVVERLIVL